MNILKVTLCLESPALFTGVSNREENSAVTLPYIPGASLRGALIARAQAAHANIVPQFFLNGSVRFLNGYLADGDERMLPTPASWRVEKHADMKYNPRVYDFAINRKTVPKPQAIDISFCYIENDAEKPRVVFGNPQREVSVHIAGKDRGEVKKSNNTVFHYEALSADQKFVAVILCETQEQADVCDQLLLSKDDLIWLGGSRSAGYGRARVVKMERKTSWHETEGHGDTDNGRVTLTLLSDMILRDANGHSPDLGVADTLPKSIQT